MATILVVDDQPANRYLSAILLGSRGHEVIEAANGAEALAVIGDRHPDLVLSDLLMPVMDGYELVRELRARPGTRATKVIFCTANYLLSEVRPVAASLGVSHIITRPAEPDTLLATVEEVLAAPPPSGGAPLPEYFHQEHLRALNAKLLAKIRDLEAAEESLGASETRLRSLTDSAPIGIFSLDVAGMVAYGNPHLRQICGVAADPGAVPAWIELLHPDDRARVAAALDEAIKAGAPYRDRVHVIRPGGESRWADVQAVPVGEAGTPSQYVGTVQDVTEALAAQRAHDELETRLRSSERLESLGQLAGGVAHDFNNLLGAMLSYCEFVTSELAELPVPGGDPRLAQLQDDVAAIRTAIDRATDLTRQLLIFGRQEFITAEVLDLNELVGEVERLLSRTIGDNIRLESRLAAGLRPVLADRGRLQQVIVNLVVNGRDAISGAGTVTITTGNLDLTEADIASCPTAEPGAYTGITVTDDGEGMTQAVAARAFEPFFTTKAKERGTGLGLATVHGIVTQLGGHAAIESEPGRGTSVRICLPSAAGAPAPPPQPSPASPATAAGLGETVLVVEDNDGMRAAVSRILTGNGYRVASARDGKAALPLLADPALTIDLLLTDMMMPGMSGPEVAASCTGLRPGLPVLFMSGYSAELAGKPPAAAGGIDLVEKPFTPAVLLRRVATALRPDDPQGPRGC